MSRVLARRSSLAPLPPPAPIDPLVDRAVVDAEMGNGSPPFSPAVLKAAAAGHLLVVAFANQWDFEGSNAQITAVTDTQGNTYNLDVAAVAPGGGATLYVASSLLTHSLSTSDTLTVTTVGNVATSYQVYAATFQNFSALRSAGTAVGSGSGGALDASVTPTTGDLIIGLLGGRIHHTYVNDDSSPWTAVVDNDGGGSWSLLSEGYGVAASGATVHYTPSTSDSVRESAVALAYQP